MKIRLADVAVFELSDACQWFEQQQPGLGDRFKLEVRKATLKIARSSLLFQKESSDVRRYVMSSFPYSLRYALRENAVLILTVSHHHRRPDYWADKMLFLDSK